MELKMIKLNEILTNPLQPRQDFDREKLQELANSIKEGELLQPIVVRGYNGKYEIVAGERRFKAFQILKEPKIPCIVRDIKDDTDALEKSLIENLQRDDLTSVERENAINQLWKSGRYKSQRELAKKLGIAERTASFNLRTYEDRERMAITAEVPSFNIYKTSGLPDETRKKIIKQVEEGKITTDKIGEVAKKIKEFPKPEQQMEILDEFEKQEDFTREAFDTIIEKKKEISQGISEPEVYFKEDKHERFVDDMERSFMDAQGYGIANIQTLPQKQYSRAVNLTLELVVYWLKQLKEMGEEGLLDVIYERVKYE